MRRPEASELGQPLSRHGGRVFAGGWLLYFALILAGGSVVSAVAGRWGEAAVLFCIAAPLLFVCWRWWNQSVAVYERGFVWKRGRRREVVHWQDVADLEAATIEDDLVLTITTADDRVLQLDSLSDMQQLHGYLINATRDREAAASSSWSSSLRL
jgi:hypothetical protein